MDGDGRFHIVEENPSVRQQKAANSELEKCVIPSPLCRSRMRGRGDIGGAVLSNDDVHMRFLNQKFIEGDSPGPQGIDAQPGPHFLCSTKGFCTGQLVSMDDQAMDSNAHGQPSNGHASKFNFSTSGGFEAAYHEPLQQGVAGTAAEKDHDAQNREHGQHPGCMNDPAPNRVTALALHFASSSKDFSM